MSELLVGRVVVRSVHTCRANDSLEIPVRAMLEKGIGCVLVVDDEGRLTGLVTDHDVCVAGYRRHRPLRDLAVAQHMTQNVRYCNEDDTVTQAAAQMERHRVRRLPVVDDCRRPIAVLTLGDVARAFRRFDLENAPVEARTLLRAASLIGDG